jgi:hypothetical protein
MADASPDGPNDNDNDTGNDKLTVRLKQLYIRRLQEVDQHLLMHRAHVLSTWSALYQASMACIVLCIQPCVYCARCVETHY